MDDVRLQGRSILVVEDEFLIADNICEELISYGAIVIGPAQSVRRAFELLEAAKTIDAAVLDVNLGGELAYPVADLLMERDVPFVFTTGYDASALPARFVSVRCCEKPVDAGAVVEALRVSTGFR